MACGCTWFRFAVFIVIVGIGIVLLRPYFKGGICLSKARLDGKFAIITGANTGIGKETARDFASRGAKVVMACRNIDRCKSAADDIFSTTGQRLTIKHLDLSDLDSVRTFAKDINTHEPRLDILVNNAGIMMCPKGLTKQGYELQFGINHIGHFLLTMSLLDLLKKSAPSRVVVVSSKAYIHGAINFDDINSKESYSLLGAYGQSKLANILFANELAERLQGTGVSVNSLHPGVIHTELTRHVFDIVPQVLRPIVEGIYKLFSYVFIKTPLDGAQTNICCSVSEELEGVTGKYFSDCAEEELLPLARDEKVAKKLWKISEEMTGLTGRT